MTNSLRGAVPFEVDGQPYSLRLTTNAQVRYEDAAGEDFAAAVTALVSNPEKRNIARVRRMFWAGLSHMGDVTEDAAGDLIDAISYPVAVRLILQAIRLGMPEAVAGNGGKAARKAAKAETETDAA